MATGREKRIWSPLGSDGPRDPRDWPEGQVVIVGPGQDLFGSDVERGFIEEVVTSMRATPRHCFVLLTRCAKRLLALGNEGLAFPPNLWLGVTVESEEEVWRAEDLLRCNTARAWVSLDPLIGPVPSLPVEMLSWVVCGEPEDLHLVEVVRQVRDRCVEAGIPFRYQCHETDDAESLPELDGKIWNQCPAELTDG